MNIQELNKLIPVDDLYWDESMKKYIVFSEEELERLCIMGVERGLSASDLHLVINEFSKWRTSEKILQRIFNGQLTFNVRNNEVLICHE